MNDLTIGFTDEQRRDAEELLSGEIPPSDLDDAMWAIEHAFHLAKVSIVHGLELAAERRAEHRHMAAVSDTARRLAELLEQRQPKWGMAGVDMAMFRTALRRIITASEAERGATQPSPAGRPPLKWRDDLVSVVFSVYPEGRAVVESGSHFVGTIEWLFDLLGHDVPNILTVIRDSLARCPRPPFTVIKTHRREIPH